MDKEGSAHDHKIDIEIKPVDDHIHDFYGITDEAGEHKHDAGDIFTKKDGEHKHKVPPNKTTKDGDHDHTFDAYLPVDYDTDPKYTDFNVAIDKIDLRKSYPIEVTEDGEHCHDIPDIYTEIAGLVCFCFHILCSELEYEYNCDLFQYIA